jgi:hypothetical protein
MSQSSQFCSKRHGKIVALSVRTLDKKHGVRGVTLDSKEMDSQNNSFPHKKQTGTEGSWRHLQTVCLRHLSFCVSQIFVLSLCSLEGDGQVYVKLPRRFGVVTLDTTVYK